MVPAIGPPPSGSSISTGMPSDSSDASRSGTEVRSARSEPETVTNGPSICDPRATENLVHTDRQVRQEDELARRQPGPERRLELREVIACDLELLGRRSPVTSRGGGHGLELGAGDRQAVTSLRDQGRLLLGGPIDLEPCVAEHPVGVSDLTAQVAQLGRRWPLTRVGVGASLGGREPCGGVLAVRGRALDRSGGLFRGSLCVETCQLEGRDGRIGLGTGLEPRGPAVVADPTRHAGLRRPDPITGLAQRRLVLARGAVGQVPAVLVPGCQRCTGGGIEGLVGRPLEGAQASERPLELQHVHPDSARPEVPEPRDLSLEEEDRSADDLHGEVTLGQLGIDLGRRGHDQLLGLVGERPRQ
jgi:hypothetical protein